MASAKPQQLSASPLGPAPVDSGTTPGLLGDRRTSTMDREEGQADGRDQGAHPVRTLNEPAAAWWGDLAVMLADGGECLSDIATLADQEALFGAQASRATGVIDMTARGSPREQHG
ncbi:MAG: hypothetical protein WKF96_12840 [Solirubrobacteraceae bacterium]